MMIVRLFAMVLVALASSMVFANEVRNFAVRGGSVSLSPAQSIIRAGSGELMRVLAPDRPMIENDLPWSILPPGDEFFGRWLISNRSATDVVLLIDYTNVSGRSLERVAQDILSNLNPLAVINAPPFVVVSAAESRSSEVFFEQFRDAPAFTIWAVRSPADEHMLRGFAERLGVPRHRVRDLVVDDPLRAVSERRAVAAFLASSTARQLTSLRVIGCFGTHCGVLPALGLSTENAQIFSDRFFDNSIWVAMSHAADVSVTRDVLSRWRSLFSSPKGTAIVQEAALSAWSPASQSDRDLFRQHMTRATPTPVAIPDPAPAPPRVVRHLKNSTIDEFEARACIQNLYRNEFERLRAITSLTEVMRSVRPGSNDVGSMRIENIAFGRCAPLQGGDFACPSEFDIILTGQLQGMASAFGITATNGRGRVVNRFRFTPFVSTLGCTRFTQ